MTEAVALPLPDGLTVAVPEVVTVMEPVAVMLAVPLDETVPEVLTVAEPLVLPEMLLDAVAEGDNVPEALMLGLPVLDADRVGGSTVAETVTLLLPDALDETVPLVL